MTALLALVVWLAGAWHTPAPAPPAPTTTTAPAAARHIAQPSTPTPTPPAPATTTPPRSIPRATTTTTAPAPTATTRPAPAWPGPSTAQPHTKPHVANIAGYCSAAGAYMHAHAKPGTAVVCPATLPPGNVADTEYTPPATVKINITTSACFAAWENEASNSYLEFTRTHFALHAESGVDPTGRHIDPYGECD